MSRPPYRPFARDTATARPAARDTAAGATTSVPRSEAPLPDTRVLGQLSALRAERVYQEAQACPDCAAARAEAGAEDALCDHHMGDALGLHAQWGLQGPGKKL